MNTKITHIVFDLDGTLIDESEVLLRQAKSVSEWFGTSDEDKKRIISAFFAANDKAQALKDSGQNEYKNNIPWYMKEIGLSFGVDINEAEAMSKKWTEAYNNSLNNPVLYNDVVPVLERLESSNIELSIASGNTKKTRKSIVSKTGIEKYFKNIYAANDVGFQKQDIRFWEKIVFELKLKPENTIVVGNQINDDILNPKKMGFRTVLIRRPGFLFKETEKIEIDPDHTIDSLHKLMPLI